MLLLEENRKGFYSNNRCVELKQSVAGVEMQGHTEVSGLEKVFKKILHREQRKEKPLFDLNAYKT